MNSDRRTITRANGSEQIMQMAIQRYLSGICTRLNASSTLYEYVIAFKRLNNYIFDI